MHPTGRLTLNDSQRAAAMALAAELRRVFGSRLQSVVAYQVDDHVDGAAPLRTLALVDRVAFEDLAACASSVARWRRAGIAVPLILGREEFDRSLDVFPVEYGEIIGRHVLIAGDPPFAATHVAESDLRRACELQAKSHLIHLREGFLEVAGDSAQIARLIASSAAAFRSLLRMIARLDHAGAPDGLSDEALTRFAEETIGVPAAIARQVLAAERHISSIADPTALLSPYIAASQRLWTYVDGWRGR
jgi:hypothetical protein